jgi:hypothetical protein
MARNFGSRIDVKYGEGFVVEELMQVEDVGKLPVGSM